MFSLENDRQDYGRLLAPPVGFELEMAVGTTYSFDLEALTLTAISLGLGDETDSLLGANPISLLNALRKVTDRVVLFYESGHLQIPVDSKNNKLFQLLEKITIPVALPSVPKGGSNYPSFHPKTWLLCYQNIETKERLYRFVVMSRNLTFDRSWDIVVAFEGKKIDTLVEESEPIAHFLRFLSHQATSDRAKHIIESLRKAVSEVKFNIGNFDGVIFMPLGLKYNGYDIDTDLWLGLGKEPFHEIMIMSPFISKDIISRFNDECRRLRITSPCERTLITRASELEKLDKESAGNFTIFTVKDEVIDGESEISDDSSSARQQDIHAKILMFARREYPSYIYIGSMNASHNGFYRNIEFDVCLWCYKGMMSPSRFLQEIVIEGPGSPFMHRKLSEVTPQENTESNTSDLAIKRICRSNAHGIVTKEDAVIKETESEIQGLEKVVESESTVSRNDIGVAVEEDSINRLRSGMNADSIKEEDSINNVEEGQNNSEIPNVNKDTLTRTLSLDYVEGGGGSGNAIISENQGELYTVTLHFNPDMITPGMRIQPITGYKSAVPIETVTKFTGIQLTDITEYFRIIIEDEDGNKHTTIIQIPLKDIPSDRNSRICQSVIDSKNRLYEYISLVLSDNKIQAILEGRDGIGGDGKFEFNFNQSTAIYEKLLEASVHHRERFREINDIIKMLPPDSEIVREFNQLYDTFRKALNLKDNG